MQMTWKGGVLVVVGIALVACSLILTTRGPVLGSEQGAQPATGGPKYTVIETQGHNLLVTDNAANKLYFYTIDKDQPVGSPLKLRASLDLSRVGQPELTITPHNLENMKKK
jgi:hypothetical protein